MNNDDLNNEYIMILETECDNYDYMAFKIVKDRMEIWKGYDKYFMTIHDSVPLIDFMALCQKVLNIHSCQIINKKFKKHLEITTKGTEENISSYDEHPDHKWSEKEKGGK